MTVPSITPTKFQDSRASALWTIIKNDNHHEEIGDVEHFGCWHAVILGFIGWHYIVTVDNFGSVTYEKFRDSKSGRGLMSLMANWEGFIYDHAAKEEEDEQSLPNA